MEVNITVPFVETILRFVIVIFPKLTVILEFPIVGLQIFMIHPFPRKIDRIRRLLSIHITLEMKPERMSGIGL